MIVLSLIVLFGNGLPFDLVLVSGFLTSGSDSLSVILECG
jgi:hypothetical protein